MKNAVRTWLLILSFSVHHLVQAGEGPDPEWINYRDGRICNAFAEIGDTIWAGSVGGLVAIHRITGGTTFYTRANSGLTSLWVKVLKADHDGNLWIGTSDGVVVKYDGLSWMSIDGMYPNCNDIAIDELRKTIRIATYQGLYAYDGIGLTLYDTGNSGLPYDLVISFHDDFLRAAVGWTGGAFDI